MPPASDPDELRVIVLATGEASIQGDLTADTAAQFEPLLRALWADGEGNIVLDCSDLDIDDGIGVATAINSMRGLLGRANRLIVKRAPQILGHNLYRAGLLENIELVEMRQDEPTES